MERTFYTDFPRTIFWLVPGGEATLGGSEEDARPTFQAEIEPFYISKWPITNEQFEAFDPHRRRSAHSPGDRDPAVDLTWAQASEYAAWYAEVSGKEIRLPSEAEWEYACRGGSEGGCFFDGEDAGEYLWDARNSEGRLQPLDAKKANGFGLHAMLGSVWEWTGSLYRPYPPPEEPDDPRTEGPRVLRGGSYLMDRDEITCSMRRSEDPRQRFADAGFRIVRPFQRSRGS